MRLESMLGFCCTEPLIPGEGVFSRWLKKKKPGKLSHVVGQKTAEVFFPLSAALYLFILDTPCSMWDLSSLTRDRTPVPLQWEHGVLTAGPPGKSSAADRLRPIDPKLKDLARTLSRSRLCQPFSQVRRQKGKEKVGGNQPGRVKSWSVSQMY